MTGHFYSFRCYDNSHLAACVNKRAYRPKQQARKPGTNGSTGSVLFLSTD